MRTVYAIQVEIKPRPGSDASAIRSAVLDRLVTWVTEKYRRQWSLGVEFPLNGGEIRPREGHRLLVQQISSAAGDLMVAEWEHPDERDPSLRWATSCQIARTTELVQVLVTVRVASARFEVRPVRFEFGRPRLVSAILSDFQCSMNESPIRTHHRRLGAAFVEDFVQRELLERSRALPILLLSPLQSGEPAIEPRCLQEWLMGYADIVELEDKWAGRRLTHAVGMELSCFNGYARLYWPGFELDADPRRFPLFPPVALQGTDRLGRDFPRQIFEQLAAAASFRLVEGAAIRAIREAAERDRLTHLEVLRRDRESNREYEQLLGIADQEIEELRESKQALEQKLADLEEQLATTRENLEAVWQRRAGRVDEEGVTEKAADLGLAAENFGSVREAVDRAEEQFGDVLEIYDVARESASASGFSRPAEVFEALEAIGDLGRAYFGSEDRKVGPWKQWFEERGIKYAHTESQTTRTRFGGTRRFRGGDREHKQMLKHLTLGGGDKVNCLQIFFEPDEEARKMEIGYCGSHLPYARQTT